MEAASIFISGIDVNDGFGFLPPWCWEWLRKDRGYGKLSTHDAFDPLPPPELGGGIG